jgi:hypothetical protein
MALLLVSLSALRMLRMSMVAGGGFVCSACGTSGVGLAEAISGQTACIAAGESRTGWMLAADKGQAALLRPRVSFCLRG